MRNFFPSGMTVLVGNSLFFWKIIWIVNQVAANPLDQTTHPSSFTHSLLSSSSPSFISPFGDTSQNISLLSSPSVLHKIIQKHDYFHAVQPAKTGASNLQKLIDRLKTYSRKHLNTAVDVKNASTSLMSKPSKLIKNAANNDASKKDTKFVPPLSVNDNSRLKRQLEGIFHVRPVAPSSTVIPILPTNSFQIDRAVSYQIHDDTSSNKNAKIVPSPNTSTPQSDVNPTTRKETRKLYSSAPRNNSQFLTPRKTFLPTKKSTAVVGNFTTPHLTNKINNGKRNYSVEVIEISRKTVIKQDDTSSTPINETLTEAEIGKLDREIQIDSKPSLNKENVLKPIIPLYTHGGNNNKPRLSFRRTRLGPPSIRGKSPDTLGQESQTVKPPQVKPLVPSVKYAKPEVSNTNSNNKRATGNSKDTKVAEVQYQEQIPYNDREIDEEDLKDYFDGHSTFGAKGDFKHTISRNVSGFLPNSVTPTTQKSTHGVYKRNPQSQTQIRSRESPSRRQPVKEEPAKVQRRNRAFQSPIYTASGVTYSPSSKQGTDEKDPGIFKYSGNKEKAKQKNPLDDLYKKGHPGILKPPPDMNQNKDMYRSHPLGALYDSRPEEEYHDTPFRADPLRDEPPLKFDPESDRFYGEPTPRRDKELAQSNRPEPVRIENQSEGPEYQERENEDKERGSTAQPQRRVDEYVDDDNKYYDGRQQYEPTRNDYDDYRHGGSNQGESSNNDVDPYIRDYISLDENFERLPRPTADEENFKSLIPPEARDDYDEGRYEDEDRRRGANGRETQPSRYDDEREGNGGSTTLRSDNDRRNNGDGYNDDRERSRGGRGRGSEGGGRGDNEHDFADGYKDSREGNFDFGPAETEGNSEDFDHSYFDALKQFDDEIKRIEEHERRGLPNENPSSSTGEPPLVITSPGPSVAYPNQRDEDGPQHPAPTSILPTRDESDDGNDHDGERSQERNGDPPSKEEDDDKSSNGDGEGQEVQEGQEGHGRQEGREGEEQNEEEEEEPEGERTTENAESRPDDSKEAAESQGSKSGIEIIKAIEVKTNDGNGKDEKKIGNLDDDIDEIQREFSATGYLKVP